MTSGIMCERFKSPFGGFLAAEGYIVVRKLIFLLGCMACRSVENLQNLGDGVARWLRTACEPVLMLKMGKLLRHSDIDELVERDTLLPREILGNLTDRRHQPERKLAHDNFLLA